MKPPFGKWDWFHAMVVLMPFPLGLLGAMRVLGGRFPVALVWGLVHSFILVGITASCYAALGWLFSKSTGPKAPSWGDRLLFSLCFMACGVVLLLIVLVVVESM